MPYSNLSYIYPSEQSSFAVASSHSSSSCATCTSFFFCSISSPQLKLCDTQTILLLFGHFPLTILIGIVVLYFVRDNTFAISHRKVHLENSIVSHESVYRPLQSDITTILSSVENVRGLIAGIWVADTTRRCIFILLEDGGMSLRSISHMALPMVPPTPPPTALAATDPVENVCQNGGFGSHCILSATTFFVNSAGINYLGCSLHPPSWRPTNGRYNSKPLRTNVELLYLLRRWTRSCGTKIGWLCRYRLGV